MDNICVVKFNCCSVPMIKATLKFRDKRAKDKYFSREFKDKKHIDNLEYIELDITNEEEVVKFFNSIENVNHNQSEMPKKKENNTKESMYPELKKCKKLK